MRRMVRYACFVVIAILLLILYAAGQQLSPTAHKALLYALIVTGASLGAFCIAAKGNGRDANGPGRE
ncbi:hypothetical protein SAMN07250955_1128 [Arboricoccus pini]|uniref:Uncharacterized protein n=1 Tax=Arboricoccus pini TaxID=1963835 RepID=A0A212RQ36_9PROT|nr:hypothetical protein [Arboricoccus pini]SNB74565.1 hypothetical protein SAMN07250955_1128 [Arboricoccus pini]